MEDIARGNREGERVEREKGWEDRNNRCWVGSEAKGEEEDKQQLRAKWEEEAENTKKQSRKWEEMGTSQWQKLPFIM